MSTTSAVMAEEIYVSLIVSSSSSSSTNSSLGNLTQLRPGGKMSFVPVPYLEQVTPVICLVGTILNLLTFGTFLSRSLRRISCCLYLATRSLAVFGFLVSMFIAWSNAFAPLMNTEGICEMTVFLSYFCPFISVWMVVIISVENFIRISQPSRVGKLCTPRVAKIVITIFVLLGLAVYNFPLWTSGIVNGTCNTLENYLQTVVVLNYIDAVLTLFCPLALMVVVVPLVALSAINAHERKKRLRGGGGPKSATRIRHPQMEPKSSPETKVTRLLLAVSVVFLLLHTPFHSIRIKLFIQALTNTTTSRNDDIMNSVFRFNYNLDTCVSCAVYLIFGANFRKIFCKMYFARCLSHNSSSQSESSANSSGFSPLSRSEMKSNITNVKNGKTVKTEENGVGNDDDPQTREVLMLGQDV